MTDLEVTVEPGLAAIDPAAWDALAGENNPFIEHAFLYALEQSGSVGADTGWAPCHLLVRRDGRLVGAAPLYLKSHSYGEYIFDWGWAHAARQAGLRYYPKLVSAVPFTPATGRRLMTEDGATEGPVFEALAGGLQAMADQSKASSVHLLFITEAEFDALPDLGLMPRLTYQYHWENPGYATFDDFLGRFRSSERRKVRKERREAAAAGLTIRTLRGPELSDAQWRHLYAFYRDTTARKGAIDYLTADFFRRLPTHLADRVLVTLAEDGGRPVAGALSFTKGDHLYGRYWGCLEAYDKLHFELCYYRPIEWCIEHGLTRFEAGAQGEHKIKRGLMPHPTWSAHWIRDPRLASAVAEFLPREAENNQAEMAWLAERGPFRREC